MKNYDPSNWYWIAQDGRVFSSTRQSNVASNDADYQLWREDGSVATAWPTDGEGQQTTDALQNVLSPYGLFASLAAYAAAARYRKEISGIVVGSVQVATDDRSKQMIMGARIAAVANPNFTTPWVGADGAIATLTAVQVIGISDAVLQHVQSCFSTFAEIVAGIINGSVDTAEEIDAAFAD